MRVTTRIVSDAGLLGATVLFAFVLDLIKVPVFAHLGIADIGRSSCLLQDALMRRIYKVYATATNH